MRYADVVAKYRVQMPPLALEASGVYAIECGITGKIYIGCSQHMLGRLHRHVLSLRKGTHINGKLQNAWNKYGESSFVFSVLEESKDIYETEKKWISEFGSENEGYNLTSGGEGGCTENEETRAKITAAIRRPEVRAKIGTWSRKHWIENYDTMCAARKEATTKLWKDPEFRARIMATRPRMSEEQREERRIKNNALRRERRRNKQ